MQGTIAYHAMPGGLISPYVGLGIGTDYSEHHLLVQEYDLNESRWDFFLAPEVGMTAKFGQDSQWGGFLAFNYKWTTNKIEFYQTELTNLQMLNLKVGLSFFVW